MKPTLSGLLLVGAFIWTRVVFSHPSSGIVVNERGEVLFVHSTRGVAKVDREGQITYVHRSTGGHWLCIDREGSFARVQPKNFLRVTPDGHRPAIIYADGGAPITVAKDGHLYFGSGWDGGHENEPGAATISRVSADGAVSAFAPKLKQTTTEIS